MPFWSWSRTPATNATADTTINWAEGQAPSSVNDSARSMMARIAEYRDDISGAIVTAGTSTAYTVASNQVFDTLGHLNGQMIAFTPHATNGDTVTLNVDGLGAKPLRSAPGAELVAGTLVQGTPYLALYNNSDAAFYLRGFFASPYNVPFLGAMDFWDTVTPNSSFIFPAGQAISRTVYSRAYARWGTTYGAGDGSTTFNVPDKRERVSVMVTTAASRLTSTYFGGNSTLLGATGGGENAPSLTQNNLPSLSLPVTGGNIAVTASGVQAQGIIKGSAVTQDSNSASAFNVFTNDKFADISAVLTGAVVATGGSGTPIRTVPPTIVTNYIIRIL